MEDAPAKKEIEVITEKIKEFLTEKNKLYGNSALEPVDIFDKIINGLEENLVVKKMLIRLCDKLSRVKNSTELRKNDVADIIGYLVLICIEKKWDDFMDLID